MQVAHEIKNPLTPMKLGIQQMEKRARDEEQDADELRKRFVSLSATLQGQIDLLARIADEFSTLARFATAGPGSRVVACDARVHGGVAPTARNPAFLDMEGEFKVQADEDQLRRLLSNLILNAQQAIGDGPGEVTLSVRGGALEVIDDGPGMPEEVAQHAFEPRFTTRGSGSGLGLAMVKAICDRHGWTVEFESKPAEGTTFRVAFNV